MAPQLTIIHIAVESLKAAEYNPRRMTEEQAADLRTSIERFGIVDPIIVNAHPDRANIVVGGHQRLAIAKTLGMKTVPCVAVNLDERQERELNLRLNKNLGEWDWDLLAHFDADELLEVGFTKDELEFHFDLKDDDEDASSNGKMNDLAYSINVACQSEEHQRELLERFEKEGLTCRALIL